MFKRETNDFYCAGYDNASLFWSHLVLVCFIAIVVANMRITMLRLEP